MRGFEQYGLIDLPSLLVFVDPVSPFDANNNLIRDHTDGKATHDEVAGALGDLPEDEAQDLVLRLTSLSHERRHFHDLLLTPFGNDLLLLSYHYAVNALALTLDLIDFGGRRRTAVSVPIEVGELQQPELLNQVRKQGDQFRVAYAAGQSVLETSAVLVQLAQARLDYGAHGERVLRNWLQNTGHSKHLRLLDLIGEITDLRGWEKSECAAWLLALSLFQTYPDSFLDDLLDGLSHRKSADLAKTLPRLFQQHINTMGTQLIEVIERNARALSQVEASDYQHGLKRVAVAALRELVECAAIFGQAFLEHPNALLSPRRYLEEPRGDWIEPLVYQHVRLDITDAGTSPVVPAPAASEDDFLLFDIVRTADGVERFVPRIRRMPFSLGRSMDAKTWRDWVDLFGGAPSLVDGIDQSNPLHEYWLTVVAEGIGMEVRTRRWRGDAAPRSPDHIE